MALPFSVSTIHDYYRLSPSTGQIRESTNENYEIPLVRMNTTSNPPTFIYNNETTDLTSYFNHNLNEYQPQSQLYTQQYSNQHPKQYYSHGKHSISTAPTHTTYHKPSQQLNYQSYKPSQNQFQSFNQQYYPSPPTKHPSRIQPSLYQSDYQYLEHEQPTQYYHHQPQYHTRNQQQLYHNQYQSQPIKNVKFYSNSDLENQEDSYFEELNDSSTLEHEMKETLALSDFSRALTPRQQQQYELPHQSYQKQQHQQHQQHQHQLYHQQQQPSQQKSKSKSKSKKSKLSDVYSYQDVVNDSDQQYTKHNHDEYLSQKRRKRLSQLSQHNINPDLYHDQYHQLHQSQGVKIPKKQSKSTRFTNQPRNLNMNRSKYNVVDQDEYIDSEIDDTDLNQGDINGDDYDDTDDNDTYYKKPPKRQKTYSLQHPQQHSQHPLQTQYQQPPPSNKHLRKQDQYDSNQQSTNKDWDIVQLSKPSNINTFNDPNTINNDQHTQSNIISKPTIDQEQFQQFLLFQQFQARFQKEQESIQQPSLSVPSRSIQPTSINEIEAAYISTHIHKQQPQQQQQPQQPQQHQQHQPTQHQPTQQHPPDYPQHKPISPNSIQHQQLLQQALLQQVQQQQHQLQSHQYSDKNEQQSRHSHQPPFDNDEQHFNNTGPNSFSTHQSNRNNTTTTNQSTAGTYNSARSEALTQAFINFQTIMKNKAKLMNRTDNIDSTNNFSIPPSNQAEIDQQHQNNGVNPTRQQHDQQQNQFPDELINEQYQHQQGKYSNTNTNDNIQHHQPPSKLNNKSNSNPDDTDHHYDKRNSFHQSYHQSYHQSIGPSSSSGSGSVPSDRSSSTSGLSSILHNQTASNSVFNETNPINSSMMTAKTSKSHQYNQYPHQNGNITNYPHTTNFDQHPQHYQQPQTSSSPPSHHLPPQSNTNQQHQLNQQPHPQQHQHQQQQQPHQFRTNANQQQQQFDHLDLSPIKTNSIHRMQNDYNNQINQQQSNLNSTIDVDVDQLNKIKSTNNDISNFNDHDANNIQPPNQDVTKYILFLQNQHYLLKKEYDSLQSAFQQAKSKQSPATSSKSTSTSSLPLIPYDNANILTLPNPHQPSESNDNFQIVEDLNPTTALKYYKVLYAHFPSYMNQFETIFQQLFQLYQNHSNQFDTIMAKIRTNQQQQYQQSNINRNNIHQLQLSPTTIATITQSEAELKHTVEKAKELMNKSHHFREQLLSFAATENQSFISDQTTHPHPQQQHDQLGQNDSFNEENQDEDDFDMNNNYINQDPNNLTHHPIESSTTSPHSSNTSPYDYSSFHNHNDNTDNNYTNQNDNFNQDNNNTNNEDLSNNFPQLFQDRNTNVFSPPHHGPVNNTTNNQFNSPNAESFRQRANSWFSTRMQFNTKPDNSF